MAAFGEAPHAVAGKGACRRWARAVSLRSTNGVSIENTILRRILVTFRPLSPASVCAWLSDRGNNACLCKSTRLSADLSVLW